MFSCLLHPLSVERWALSAFEMGTTRALACPCYPLRRQTGGGGAGGEVAPRRKFRRLVPRSISAFYRKTPASGCIRR